MNYIYIYTRTQYIRGGKVLCELFGERIGDVGGGVGGLKREETEKGF